MKRIRFINNISTESWLLRGRLHEIRIAEVEPLK